jgi:hypothetical protein
MKTGDILICKRKSFLSKLIRKVTKSEWSHTSAVIDIWGKIYIVEMQSKGVELIAYDEWVDKWKYEYIIFRNPFEIDAAEFSKKALSVVGRKTKYDYFTFIFRIPYKIVTNKYKYKGEEIETRRMICSQLTAWLNDLPEWYKSTPEKQFNYLQKNWIKIDDI